MPSAVLHDSHLFESAWRLDSLKLFGGHVALHIIRSVHLLSGATLRSIHRLLHNSEYVVAQGETLVRLLALNALLVPSVQSVSQTILVHEDVAGGVRCGIFTCIMLHSALTSLKA